MLSGLIRVSSSAKHWEEEFGFHGRRRSDFALEGDALRRSGDGFRCLAPQRIDQFVHLVRDGLDFVILRRVVIDAQAKVADAVAVVAGSGDGGIELRLQVGDLCGLGVDLRQPRCATKTGGSPDIGADGN